MMKNLGQMMKQAQEMQTKMADLQKQLELLSVNGQAGGGLVTVEIDGKGNMKSVKIEKSLADPEEVEVLEDLITAAFNDAKVKLDQKVQEETQRMMGEIGLPPGMQLPF